MGLEKKEFKELELNEIYEFWTDDNGIKCYLYKYRPLKGLIKRDLVCAFGFNEGKITDAVFGRLVNYDGQRWSLFTIKGYRINERINPLETFPNGFKEHTFYRHMLTRVPDEEAIIMKDEINKLLNEPLTYFSKANQK